MDYLDKHPDVIQWSSEEIAIPYKHPLDKRYHRYFPDFWVKQRNHEGKIEEIIIEVKPLAHTKQPAKFVTEETNLKKRRRQKADIVRYVINEAKWIAAKAFCQTNNMRFVIMTERDIGIKY